jgi:hypothetical protein
MRFYGSQELNVIGVIKRVHSRYNKSWAKFGSESGIFKIFRDEAIHGVAKRCGCGSR